MKPPDETLLHDWVDGKLSGDARRHVERWLDAHPQAAGAWRAWQRDAQQLRAALAAEPALAERPDLAPSVLRRRRADMRRARLAWAALLLLSLGLGLVGGWELRERTALRHRVPMADAMQAHHLFAMQPGLSPDLAAASRATLQGWLQARFHDVAPLPDLAPQGFRPDGARLLSTSEGPAAIVVYADAAGRTISFYVRPPGPGHGMLPRGESRADGLRAAYWSDRAWNYAVVGRDTAHDARVLRAALSES